MTHVVLHGRFPDMGRVFLAPIREERRVATEITAIRSARVRREPAFDREPILVFLEQPREPGHVVNAAALPIWSVSMGRRGSRPSAR